MQQWKDNSWSFNDLLEFGPNSPSTEEGPSCPDPGYRSWSCSRCSKRNSAGPTHGNRKRARESASCRHCPPPIPPSVESVRDVETEPPESASLTSSPSPSPDYHAQAEHSPDPVSVYIEEAPSSKLASSAGINVNDYGDELAAKVYKYHRALVRDESYFRDFSKELLPRIERKLKARIDIRKRLNQRLGARLAEIEECNKYCAKMEKMMEELKAAREETDRLESSIKPAAEKFKDSSKEWFRLGGEWGAEAEWMSDRSQHEARGVDDELEVAEGRG